MTEAVKAAKLRHRGPATKEKQRLAGVKASAKQVYVVVCDEWSPLALPCLQMLRRDAALRGPRADPEALHAGGDGVATPRVAVELGDHHRGDELATRLHPVREGLPDRAGDLDHRL